ncbi:hypothetical protein D3C86_1476670 [compost metagenome]
MISQSTLVESKVPVPVVQVINVRVHIVTRKGIQVPVVIDVHKIRTLAENIFRTGNFRISCSICIGHHKCNTRTASVHHVVEPVLVDITDCHTPARLELGVGSCDVTCNKCPADLLVKDLNTGRRYGNDIVQEISVHIRYSQTVSSADCRKIMSCECDWGSWRYYNRAFCQLKAKTIG